MSEAPPTTASPRVLLRSSWQMANIGDMAHAPSAIGLFARLAPDIEFVLWARRISPEEIVTLTGWYPGLRVVTGELDGLGRASTPELAEELERCTFLLHGSGRLFAGEPDVRHWSALTGKPYGFFGITVDPLSPTVMSTLAEMASVTEHLGGEHMDLDRRALLEGAGFVYCRDSISVGYLRRHGLDSATVCFGPDAVFAFDPPDKASAGDELRHSLGLADDGYVCVIPRLRYTPYHRMLGTTAGAAEVLKDAVNAVYREPELGLLQDVIIDIVRDKGRQVLIAPEMTYAGQLGAEIAASLPDDVRASVSVLTDFWTPAEAMAVFAGASAVVSMECHSPILAGRVGVPSLYLRQPTDTIKGQMWADVGLADRIFELDDCDSRQVSASVSRFIDDPEAARAQSLAHAEDAASLLGALALQAASVIRGEASALSAAPITLGALL